jgi:hypothetical protein
MDREKLHVAYLQGKQNVLKSNTSTSGIERVEAQIRYFERQGLFLPSIETPK